MQPPPSQPPVFGTQLPQGHAQQMLAAWPLYLPTVEFDAGDRRALLVQALLEALSSDAGWQLLRRLRAYLPQASCVARTLKLGRRASRHMHRWLGAILLAHAWQWPWHARVSNPQMHGLKPRALQEYVLPLDYDSLLQLSGGSEDLEAALELEPLEALACIGAAVHEVRMRMGRVCTSPCAQPEHVLTKAESLRRSGASSPPVPPNPRAGAVCGAQGAVRVAARRSPGARPRGGAAAQLRPADAHAVAQVQVHRWVQLQMAMQKMHTNLCGICGSAAGVTLGRKHARAGRLVTIRGTVVRMSHIRPLIVEMDFTCAKCGATQHAAFPDGRFAPPTRCSGRPSRHTFGAPGTQPPYQPALHPAAFATGRCMCLLTMPLLMLRAMADGPMQVAAAGAGRLSRTALQPSGSYKA